MKVGVLFSGYGTQFVGMGKEIYDTSRIVQEYFEEASNCANINFVKLCFASSDAELAVIQNAYLALFLTEVSIASAIKEIGFEFEKVAGYGVGEFAAICVSKGISFPDGIYLLTKISQLYSELISVIDLKSILISGPTLKELKAIITEADPENNLAQIVSFNGPTEFVVTSDKLTIDKIIIEAKKKRAKITNLSTDSGLYSNFAEPIVQSITMYLEKIDFKDTVNNIVFGLDGKSATDAKQIKKRVIKQLVNPILWDKVLAQFSDCDMILIPSPGKELTQKVQDYYPDKKVVLVSEPQDLDNLKILFEENKQ